MALRGQLPPLIPPRFAAVVPVADPPLLVTRLAVALPTLPQLTGPPFDVRVLGTLPVRRTQAGRGITVGQVEQVAEQLVLVAARERVAVANGQPPPRQGQDEQHGHDQEGEGERELASHGGPPMPGLSIQYAPA